MGCLLAGRHLYEELKLDRFWAERLSPRRKGTRWGWIVQTLSAYPLIDADSERRLHREWLERWAMGDLLGADFAAVAEAQKLYGCHDLLLQHKRELFNHLLQRWRDLFNATFEVPLLGFPSGQGTTAPPAAPPLPRFSARSVHCRRQLMPLQRSLWSKWGPRISSIRPMNSPSPISCARR